MRAFSTILLLAALLSFSVASAHVEAGDCVIHDFTSDITLNTDSLVDITENLTVDGGGGGSW